MTTDFVFALLFGGTAPLLLCQLMAGGRLCLMLTLVLTGLSAARVIEGAPLWQGIAHGATFWLTFLVPTLYQRFLRRLRRESSHRLIHLGEQRDRLAQKHDKLSHDLEKTGQELERLQNRFALVQVMATKLEAADILQTLGHLWKKRPGVQGCLILRRHINGHWGTAYTDGFFNAQNWIRFLTAHPPFARLRRVRRTAPLGRQLSFPGRAFGSSCLLVPFSWDKDLLAMGVLEVDPMHLEEDDEGLNVERKLISIGLRRSDLYDLMIERSRYDALTGAFLRRSLMERLDDALRKSLRYGTQVFAALLDIDHFKGINDRHGHVVGDRVLVHLSQAVRALSHPGISLGRFGGDEFAVILEMDSLEEVMDWFERLRASLKETPLEEGGQEISVTVSVGVCGHLPDRPAIKDLLSRADEALYQAKKNGRDRVVAWRRSGPAASVKT